MSKLMVSVAGIRGIVGDSLTPDVIVDYTKAFHKFSGEGPIVLGRDTRPSGKQIVELVASVLNFCGRDVIDVGIATTPSVALGVEFYKAAGGICITASHNPSEWNALKFFGPNTLFLDVEQGEKLQECLRDDTNPFVSFEKIGKTEKKQEELSQYHIQKVLDISFLDRSAIRKKNFKVVIDCVNGAGSEILPQMLHNLGCTVTKLNCTPNGIFPHGAEPLPENLTEICEKIKEGNFDLGMVVDPDADRLALVSDAGIPLGEEYTLAMVADLVLSKYKSDLVANVSTTRALDDIAEKYGSKVYRTKVGEINVSKKMLECNCLIGGEGNGGIIMPTVHPGRDSLVGAALILQYLLEKDDFITNIFQDLPQYVILKDKTGVDGVDVDSTIKAILESEKDAKVDETDGVKLIYQNSWVQLRKSNTEPIVRIFAEAPTIEEAQALLDKFKAKLS